jgi:hypothetical protein
METVRAPMMEIMMEMETRTRENPRMGRGILMMTRTTVERIPVTPMRVMMRMGKIPMVMMGIPLERMKGKGMMRAIARAMETRMGIVRAMGKIPMGMMGTSPVMAGIVTPHRDRRGHRIRARLKLVVALARENPRIFRTL